jgi:uncharacterized integral membrane protein
VGAAQDSRVLSRPGHPERGEGSDIGVAEKRQWVRDRGAQLETGEHTREEQKGMTRSRGDQPDGADERGPADGGSGLAGRPPERPTEEALGGQPRSRGGTAEEGTPGGEAADTEGRAVPTSVRAAQAGVLLLAVLFGVFALVNSQPVDFSWVFGETQVERGDGGAVISGGVPLIVLLLLSFILGAALGGWWVSAASKARRRRDTETS